MPTTSPPFVLLKTIDMASRPKLHGQKVALIKQKTNGKMLVKLEATGEFLVLDEKHLKSQPIEIKTDCSFCGATPIAGLPLKACSKCEMAHYCNKDCQKADWKTHKKACPIMKQISVTVKEQQEVIKVENNPKKYNHLKAEDCAEVPMRYYALLADFTGDWYDVGEENMPDLLVCLPLWEQPESFESMFGNGKEIPDAEMEKLLTIFCCRHFNNQLDIQDGQSAPGYECDFIREQKESFCRLVAYVHHLGTGSHMVRAVSPQEYWEKKGNSSSWSGIIKFESLMPAGWSYSRKKKLASGCPLELIREWDNAIAFRKKLRVDMFHSSFVPHESEEGTD